MTTKLYDDAKPEPSAEVERVMELADAAIGHAVRVANGERPCNASESRAALRAEVERLARRVQA